MYNLPSFYMPLCLFSEYSLYISLKVLYKEVEFNHDYQYFILFAFINKTKTPN